MLNFNSAVDAILGDIGSQTIALAIPSQEPEVTAEKDFEAFKHFLIGYVQEHDDLTSDHSTIKQIANMNSIHDIEQLLRHNHEYCEDCLLKMYRKYAVGDEPGSMCGCGGE